MVEVVERLPPSETDEPPEPAEVSPYARFVEIWRGEDEVLRKDLLEQLGDAGIVAECRPTREAAGCGLDPASRGVEPRFGFIVRVHPKDETRALSILEKILQGVPVDFSIPSGAPTRSVRTSKVHPPDLALASAEDEQEPHEWKCVWEGTDAAQRDFVQASLRENGIRTESRFQRRSYRILVQDSAERDAAETVKEILEGKPPSFEPEEPEELAESGLVKEQLWPFSILTAVVVVIVFALLPASTWENPTYLELCQFVACVAALGSLWAIYQVLRYEHHPLRYLIMVVLPFAFVWYYLGRYVPRAKGAIP